MSKRKPTGGPSANQPLLSFKRAKKGDDESDDASPSSSVAQPPRQHVSVEEFQGLLDFSRLTSVEEVKERFDVLSKALIYDVVLVVAKEGGEEGESAEVEFQVLEAEFYLQIQDIHEDPFTHGSEEQKVAGRWYFHRAPRRSEDSTRSATSLTMYRDGSRKGLDLTIAGPPLSAVDSQPGQPASSPATSERLLRGGILLRSVRRLGKGGKVTSGPSLLVDQILAASGAKEIKTLVNEFWNRDISAFLPPADAKTKKKTTTFFIRSRQASSSSSQAIPPLYFSPRIGLDLSHPGTTPTSKLPLHPRITFLARRYRFFVYPTELTANGRAHTFVGLLLTLLRSTTPVAAASSSSSDPTTTTMADKDDAQMTTQPHRRKLLAEIVKLGGFQPATAERYLDDFIEGRKGGKGVLDALCGIKGKGASSAPRTCLKMFGALSVVVPDEMGGLNRVGNNAVAQS